MFKVEDKNVDHLHNGLANLSNFKFVNSFVKFSKKWNSLELLFALENNNYKKENN